MSGDLQTNRARRCAEHRILIDRPIDAVWKRACDLRAVGGSLAGLQVRAAAPNGDTVRAEAWITLAPLRLQLVGTAAVVDIDDLAHRAIVRAAALLLERPALCDPLALYYFSRNHHLTEREERVLDEVATGATVAEVAAVLGMKLPTARTHVRHILEKTGRESLRDLTARLAKLPPVAARDPSGGALAHEGGVRASGNAMANEPAFACA